MANANGAHTVKHNVFAGFVGGHTSGREDRIRLPVENDSFVIPADVVSALGDGSSLAGAAKLHAMFELTSARRIASFWEREAYNEAYADGGRVRNPVKVWVSSGEFIVSPMQCLGRFPGGDIHTAHDELDLFVLSTRVAWIGTLLKLPPPVRSKQRGKTHA